MIDRYTTVRMRNIWSMKNRWNLFLDVELAYLEALEEDKIATPGQAKKIKDLVTIDPDRIAALEQTLRHDVIAFLTHVEEQAGEATRFLHYGLTSSDVLDTVFALQLKQATAYILEEMSNLTDALDELAQRHKKTPIAGRTHGMHAEATSFGLVVLSWRESVIRSHNRLIAAANDIATGKLSGAVGNLAFGDPQREKRVLERLGLRPEPVASQIVARDRHAALFVSMAMAGSVLDNIATNIRHLQRTEVGEVYEPFGSGQRGSSAMPHKKNPVLCENVTGQARLLRSYALAALENVPLWHERDISHSSVERVIGPDATSALEFACKRLCGVIKGLTVNEDVMAKNLEHSGGIIHSEGVLLALVSSGMRRQDAYALVQRCALKAISGEGSFIENLKSDADIKLRLSDEEIDQCFSIKEHLRWTDDLYARRSKITA